MIPHRLAATRVAAGGRPDRHLVMLHGIYGRGRNWKSVAAAFVAARPEFACWLVDLPHHGDSGPGTHGESVIGLAADVADWMDAEGILPDAILGHSYGGKVALALAERWRDRPLRLFVVDSTPETKPPSGSAWQMLQVVRSLPDRFATREAAVSAIGQAGFSPGVAQWMATNLVRQEGAFVWRLDFDVMDRLLHDFFTTDLWHVVERPAPAHRIHFLKASQSNAISSEAVRRIERAPAENVEVHHREGGHWIHAESPQVVTDLLVETL